MLQAQYVFIHDAMLEVLTTGWSDIAVDQLADRMAELEEEDEEDDDGESGYLTEFNVRRKSSHRLCNDYDCLHRN